METIEIIEDVEKQSIASPDPIPKPEKKIQQKSASYVEKDNIQPEYWELTFKKNTRNSLLQLTDKYILQDFPITEEKRNAIMEYREYLRNFININTEAILRGEDIEILPIPF